MIAAMFLPRGNEISLADALQLAADRGLVLCVPSNFSRDEEFHTMAFHPDHIRKGWKRAIVVVKSPTVAKLEDPCVA